MPHGIIQVFIAVEESVASTSQIIFEYESMVLIIPLLILATETKSSSSSLKDRNNSLIHRNRTNADLKKQSVQTDYREYSNIDSNPRLKRDHYEVRKRRPKKKRQTLHLAKQVQHGKRQAFFNQGNDEKIYETFEEIHEHINEPSNEDGQVQASERYESHEETLSGGEVQSDEEPKQEQQKEESPVKIKVKHHHHHHHHNHIKEVIKTVPKPYKPTTTRHLT
ncbi:hypothetical protein ACLKA7_003435 [Drosophila subpalustris]